jgi:hypothetical protein
MPTPNTSRIIFVLAVGVLTLGSLYFYAYGVHLLGVANTGFQAFPEAWQNNTLLYLSFWTIEAIGLLCVMLSILLLYKATRLVMEV